jgi:quinol monooxygenase YgiN
MFSRMLTMHLKPNHVTNLIKVIDETVLPLLRKQEGFKDAVFFADASGTEAMAISLWDRKENAETYANKTYPQVLESLTSLLDGTPQVKALNVLSSTFHKAPAAV